MGILAENAYDNFLKKIRNKNLTLQERKGELLLRGLNGKLNKEQVALIKKDASIINFIKENKAELVQYLSNHAANAAGKNQDKKNIIAMYELSPVQEGMLFHGLFDNGSTAYMEQYVFDFNEGLDIPAFKLSAEYVINNHSILRSNFLHDQFSIPVQCVFRKVSLPLVIIDFSQYTEAVQAQKMEQYLEEDKNTKFDFSKAPLIRVALIKVSEIAYKMVWTHHHILLDGWSMPIVMAELMGAYECYGRGKLPAQQKVDLYEDFIKYIKSKDSFDEEQFWTNYMNGFDTPSLLPFVSDKIERNNGGELKEIPLSFDSVFTEKIRAYAQRNRLTVNTIVQGMWSLMLSKYTGNPDVAFGVTVSGRPGDLNGAEERVGMFINTLPLRTIVDDSRGVVEWLAEVQNEHTQAREYQYSAISNIQRWAKVTGDFFDSIIVFENFPMGEVIEQDALLKVGDVEISDGNNYLLSIIAVLNEELNLKFSFNNSLLDEGQVEVMIGHFKNLLEQLAHAPSNEEEATAIAELNLISAEERALVLGERATADGEFFNRGAVDLGNDLPINVRFEEMVKAHKNEVAIIHGSENYSYGQLNKRANQIAHGLQKMGVESKDLVGVYLDRGLDLVACLLGIMKIGAVYIPLDTQNPKERIEKMIANSAMPTVISTTSQIAELEDFKTEHLLFLDRCADAADMTFLAKGIVVRDIEYVEKQPLWNLPNPNELTSWAYMLYTSGTTGEPKAAITRHDGAMNHILAEYAALELEDGFRFLQSAGIGSDISLWQILAPLLKAGAVVIVDKADLLNIDLILDTLSSNKVSIVEFVPSYIWSIVEYIQETGKECPLPDLKWIMMVGEAVPVKLVNNWRTLFPQVRVLNGYGPCEASDDITQYEVTSTLDELQQRVPIGQPIANMNTYVVDADVNLCPIGVAGEICVSGVGVGAGYYGLPEKTAASFIKNPFEQNLGKVLYKTGDLGRWLPDGNLEFLGRIDRQLKIRGHRVELGEIESFLREESKVTDIHLIAHKGEANKIALIAFVVAEHGKVDDQALNGQLENSLRERCGSGLPEYMHPTYYCFVEKMPLNLSDKVDEKKLMKQFDEQGFVAVAEQLNYVAPRNDAEARLAEIWQKLLRIEKVGVFDNFFKLGGNSLVAIRLIVQINKAFATNLNVADIFQLPSINAMMQKIWMDKMHEEDAIVKVINKGNDTKSPIFCVPGAGGNVLTYSELGIAMGTDQPFYSFQTPGLDGKTESLKTVEEMAEKFVAGMQEVDAHGPYTLGGYSMGGIVAYEMARQLKKAGFEVNHLILFDAAAPGVNISDIENTEEHYNKVLVRIANEMAEFMGGTIELKLEDIQDQNRAHQIKIALKKLNDCATMEFSEAQLRGYMQVVMDSTILEQNYNPPADELKDVPILLFKASAAEINLEIDKPDGLQNTLGWNNYTNAKITTIDIEGGDHESFLNQPYVRRIANYLIDHLNQKK